MEIEPIRNEPNIIDYDLKSFYDNTTEFIISKSFSKMTIKYEYYKPEIYDSERVNLYIEMEKDDCWVYSIFDTWKVKNISYKTNYTSFEYNEPIYDKETFMRHKHEIEKSKIKINRYLTNNHIIFSLQSIGNKYEYIDNITNIMNHIHCNKIN